MPSLTDKAGDERIPAEEALRKASQRWQESMLRRLEVLRATLREHAPEALAARSGGSLGREGLLLTYWGQPVAVSWPDLNAISLPDGSPCSTFYAAVLLYYLHTADGTPMAEHWIGFRELPDGAFYHQAFQGYSGDRLARAYDQNPAAFDSASRALGGLRLSALANHAFAFQPLPRIRLAAVLWPGDEDLPTRASVLFDAAASHYMTTDGLALLGAGLSRRLEKLKSKIAP
jgi:hypothetical protein